MECDQVSSGKPMLEHLLKTLHFFVEKKQCKTVDVRPTLQDKLHPPNNVEKLDQTDADTMNHKSHPM